MKTSLVAITLLFASLASGFAAPEPAQERLRFRGFISGWRLDMDGTLFLRLEKKQGEASDSDGEATGRELWFRTPPDRSSVIATEELLLAVVLDAGDEEEYAVTADSERVLNGSNPENAYQLISISR